MKTIAFEIDLVVDTCCVCGTVFAMERVFQQKRRRDGGGFYCPNGHVLVYRETEVDRLKKKLDEVKTELKATKEDVEWWTMEASKKARELQHTERRLSATKGVLTRTKNRVSKGICPCCNRQFVNLHRHMQNQHPDYTHQEEGE